MDLCNRFDLRGQNCLLITGIDDSYTIKEITEFFEANGPVKKVVRVPDESDQPAGRVLVEYASDRTVSRLDPSKVGNLPSPKDLAVIWNVKTIREICQDDLGRELAQRYLSELQSLHSSSKAGFFSILQNELQNLQADSCSPGSSKQPYIPSLHADDSLCDPLASGSNLPHVADVRNQHSNCQEIPETRPTSYAPPSSAYSSPPHVDEGIMNPPQIQRLVVEHIMRSELPPSSYSQSRIKTFSGRLPKPNGEVDYDAWRTQVDLLLCDTSLSENQKVRRILESLLSPAAEIVKPLGTGSHPSAYLEQLEAAFGLVEDGEELFATFLSSNQNTGEKPSAYLNRLHVLLTKAISRGGVAALGSDKHLLRQFCRGCWDQSLIVGLQLEHKKDHPPSFPELLLMLRTEEDRRSAKLERMRKHLGNARAVSHVHSAFNLPVYEEEPAVTAPKKLDTTHRLEKEVAELRKQVASLTSKEKLEAREHSCISSPAGNQRTVHGDCLIASPVHPQQVARDPPYPRPWFCFKCGQDGHIAARCDNEPNSALVQRKNSELKVRRDKFRMEQEASQQILNL